MTFHFFQATKTSKDGNPAFQTKYHKKEFKYNCQKSKFQLKLASNDFQESNENNSSLLKNLSESEASSVLHSSQSSVVQESFIEIPANSEISINQLFPLENLEELSRSENISMIKNLLKLLAFPRHLIRRVIKLSKKNRVILLSILQICFIGLCCYYATLFAYNIIFPFLMSTFRALREKINLQRSKLKQPLNNPDQVQESKEFWDTHLDSLSQVIKINRGGSLVAIREANIYNFSELDMQQALLSISPIPAYIQLERSKAEVEKFIDKSYRKRLSLKTLKDFPSKLKKFIAFPDYRLRKKLKQGVIGLALFLLLETGNPMFQRTRSAMNFESVSTTKVVVIQALPAVDSPVDKVVVKVPLTIESLLTETKDIVKTHSSLGPGSRARKRAKLAKLADLPSLSEQNFDREIESVPNAKSTAIKIHID
jgi:hypothetical protein